MRSLLMLVLACTAAFTLVPAQAHPQQQSPPVRRLVEEFRFGSSDTSHLTSLTRVSALLVLPDGRVITAHSRESIVRVFDTKQRTVSRLGSAGDGPGEYRSPNGLGMLGDTLWIRDALGFRYLMYDKNLKPLGTLRMRMVGGYYYGLLSSQASVMRGINDTTHVTILDNTGNPLRQVQIQSRRARHQFNVRDETAETGTRRVTSPLESQTEIALLPGGHEMVVLEPWSIWGGTPGQLAIRRLSLNNGTLSPPAIIQLPARRISSSEAHSIVNEYSRLFDGATAQAVRTEARVPAFYPPFRLVEVMDNGLLWLQDAARRDHWTVASVSGEVVMTLTVPPGVRIFTATRTHAWGVHLNQDDVPAIVRFRIE